MQMKLIACDKSPYKVTDTRLKFDDNLLTLEEMKEKISDFPTLVEIFSHGAKAWNVIHQGDDPDAKYRIWMSYEEESQWFSLAFKDVVKDELEYAAGPTCTDMPGPRKPNPDSPGGAKIHDKIKAFDAMTLVYNILLGEELDDPNISEALIIEDGVNIPKVIVLGLCIMLDMDGLSWLSLLPGGNKSVNIAMQLRQV